MRLLAALAATPLLALGVVAGCYTVDFDENRSDVYYCQVDITDNDETDGCGEGRACQLSRCVDDSGPHVELTGPEPLTPYADNEASMEVVYSLTNFEVVESNSVVEGEGKIKVLIDDGSVVPPIHSIEREGITVDISALAPGPHRVWVQATYGDETEYTNPSSSDYVVFWVDSPPPCPDCYAQPHTAIVYPPPKHTHVAGEDLPVAVATRNFKLVENLSTDNNPDLPPMTKDCVPSEACMPFTAYDPLVCFPDLDMDPETVEECQLLQRGHAHVYLLDDFPECLDDEPVGCTDQYALTLRPNSSEDVISNDDEISATLPGEDLTEPGVYTFTVALQHNNHDSYPNNSQAIYDQFTIEIVER